MSIVFDARKHAEQSKRAREAIAAIPQSGQSGPPSSDPQDTAPASKESPNPGKELGCAAAGGAISTLSEAPASTSPTEPDSASRVARSNAAWATARDIAKDADAEQTPIVRSLLRAARSGPLSAAPPASNSTPKGGTIEPAALIVRTDPAYPTIARESLISGTVEVQFRISADGKVYDAKSVTGPPILARAAIEAVEAWCYEPARLYGAPIDSHASTNFDFKLN